MKQSLFLIIILFVLAIGDSANAYTRGNVRRRSFSTRLLSINVDPQQALNTAFRVAAREGRLETVKTLLSEGAQIDGVSGEGKTALIYAARRGKVDVVNFLLEAKANPNIQDSSGRTALIHATRGMCLHVVKVLLRNQNLKPFIRDKSGRFAADYIELSLEMSELFGRHSALPKS